MDNFSKRRSRLRSFISVNQSLTLYFDSAYIDVSTIAVPGNHVAMLCLGESLSILKPVSSKKYLEDCISCLKDYERKSKQKLFRRPLRSKHTTSTPQMPFPLDGRTVFTALCQAFIAVYQTIEDLTRYGFTSSDENLYWKLHDLIGLHIIRVGVEALENPAHSIEQRERFMLGGR